MSPVAPSESTTPKTQRRLGRLFTTDRHDYAEGTGSGRLPTLITVSCWLFIAVHASTGHACSKGRNVVLCADGIQKEFISTAIKTNSTVYCVGFVSVRPVPSYLFGQYCSKSTQTHSDQTRWIAHSACWYQLLVYIGSPSLRGLPWASELGRKSHLRTQFTYSIPCPVLQSHIQSHTHTHTTPTPIPTSPRHLVLDT